jgi:hypothetical protein
MKKQIILLLVTLLTQTVFSQNFEFTIEGKQLTVIEKYDSGKKKAVSNYIGKKIESINENNFQSAVDSKQIKLHGEFIKYYENGQIKLRSSYKKGTQDYSIQEMYTSNGEKIFTICDVMPKYKDGQQALFETISAKVKSHPKVSAIGVVFVSFIIDKEGRVTEVECLRGLNTEIDNIAVEAVKGLGLFTPAMQQGKPVNCAYNLPIRFEK